MNTQDKTLIVIGTTIIFAWLVAAIVYTSNNDYPPTITNKSVEVSYPDTATSMLEPLFSVPVIRVSRSNMDGMKWEVESENGIIFYTNNKYKVGDVAFYMDGTTEKVYWIKE
jgi:hypothetical protein